MNAAGTIGSFNSDDQTFTMALSSYAGLTHESPTISIHAHFLESDKEVFTLPPFFWPDSARTLSDSTYPECQFFGSGTAGIVW